MASPVYTARMESRSAPLAQQQHSPSASPLLALVAWCSLFLLAALAIFELKAPDAVPASARHGEFSAERALAHVRAIARVPHPIGTNANAEARQYLISQLSALGMNPQVSMAIGVDNGSGALVAGRTNNIVGRISGTANSGAILLMAHYDSVPSGPGAGDDAAGVAAILEGLRALKTGPPLKNDLIALITDGEEAGLLGAEAFVASHPWIKDVGLVMNFEARGNRGPSLLFETSIDNAALLNEVTKAAPYPVGSSLFYGLYKLLPNDTDFTRFRSARIPGVNLAFGSRLEAYHSWLDTPENLDTASLQHHGSYLLSLARHFGQMDLDRLKQQSGDDIFFDWFGSSLITYNERWVLIGQIVVTLLLLLVVFSSVRRAEVRPKCFLAAIAVSLLTLPVIPAVMAVAEWVILQVLSRRTLLGDTPANSFLLIGLTMLGVVTGSVVLAKSRRRFNLQEWSLAGLTVVCILGWALALLLPAGNYLVFWPLLLATCGLLALTILKAGSPKAHAAGTVPAVAITVLLFAPMAYLLYTFLTLNFLSVAAVGLLVGLFFLICAPFLNIAVSDRPWRTILLPMLVVAAACVAAGIIQSHFSSQHPRYDNLLYSLNADDHTAVWISDDPALDGYTSRFLGKTPSRQPIPNYLNGSQRRPFSASAAVIDLQPPLSEIEADEQQGILHHLRMNVKSQRDADLIVIRFDPSAKPVSDRNLRTRCEASVWPGGAVHAVVRNGFTWRHSGFDVECAIRCFILDQRLFCWPAHNSPALARIRRCSGQ
jgi:Peptidase family M28